MEHGAYAGICTARRKREVSMKRISTLTLARLRNVLRGGDPLLPQQVPAPWTPPASRTYGFCPGRGHAGAGCGKSPTD